MATTSWKSSAPVTPFGILHCLAMAAAKTIKLSDCIDDKVAGVSAFSLQTLEFLTEEDEGNE